MLSKNFIYRPPPPMGELLAGVTFAFSILLRKILLSHFTVFYVKSLNFQFKVFLPEYSRNLTCLVLLGPGSFFRISLIGSDQLWKFCPICEKSDRGNIRTKEMINKTNRGIISYLQLIFAILDDISFNFIYLTLLNL